MVFPKARSSFVRFEETATVWTTTTTSSPEEEHITPAEAVAYWYNQSEIEEMTREAQAIARLHEENKSFLDENEFPQRGLESFIEMANGKTALTSRQAVFNEQALSLRGAGRKHGLSSKAQAQLQIQKSYTTYTQASCMQARFLAMMDEVAVGRA